MTALARSCRAALPRDALQAKGGAMKDARGLDVTGSDPAAVAAADDFAARLLRLDQGVEAILDAAKRWPDTPIVQLYAAAFWLYGQTDGALESAGVHLRACGALAMNARECALHRVLALWHGNDNLCAVEALEANRRTARWRTPSSRENPDRPRARLRDGACARESAGPYIAGQAHNRGTPRSWRSRDRSATRSASSRETRGRSTPPPTSSSARAATGRGCRR